MDCRGRSLGNVLVNSGDMGCSRGRCRAYALVAGGAAIARKYIGRISLRWSDAQRCHLVNQRTRCNHRLTPGLVGGTSRHNREALELVEQRCDRGPRESHILSWNPYGESRLERLP